ncbi:TPA: hypothetical protein KEY68_000175 [Providencia rettgeri]|uniref:hypothetical protein n=1 Tax=Providencia sp. PROV141 TaxID=2949851 RepID=UPI001B9C8C0C|nr:hypothetical protein [Providencia sp. PROV141]HBC7427953.1 hypothetical protein [Providencia rettgeri]
MNDKVDNWIDKAERVINLIRPKAYNTIAKVTILTGLGLIGESQINFIHAIVAAIFEEYIGKSEILRTVLDVSGSPITGFLLVVVGMIYHIIVTLGNEYINTKKSELPKYPMLKFFFKNKHDSSFSNGEMHLDKPKYTFEQCQSIPEYSKTVENTEEHLSANETPLSKSLKFIDYSLPSGYQHPKTTKVNKRFYKERLDILQEWLGYEKLCLSIANDSEIFANDIKVKISIPRNGRITVKTTRDKIPKRPETHINVGPIGMLNSNCSNEPFYDKYRPFITESDDIYEINWRIEKLQAKTFTGSSFGLWVKINEPIDIDCTVFCDQLPRPFNSKITLHPSSNIEVIELADIIEGENFERLYISIREAFKEDDD